MDGIEIRIRLHPALHDAALDLCAEADITLGQLVRDLLSKEVSRRRNARPPVRADERLVAPLRARLAPPLAAARNWTQAQESLRHLGYELREAGGGLALHAWPSGQRLCKASELGFSYARLIERFAAPFPGHAHDWLAKRVLNRLPPEDDAEFEVIERDWPRRSFADPSDHAVVIGQKP